MESCPENAVVLERVADAIVVCNGDLTLLRYSNAGGVLLGLARDTIGRRIDTCARAPVLERLAAAMAVSLRNGCVVEREIAVGERLYLVRLVPEPSLDAGRGGVIVAFFDHTERIGIARESRRIATLLDQSDDAITMHDFAGRILAWNKGAERMYGYVEAEALTMNVEALLPADQREEHRSIVARLVGKGAEDTNQCYETVRLRKDGRSIDVWVTTSSLRDEYGVAYAIAATERDLTLRNEIEAKRLRAELAHLERVGIMGEMAASLAHEVNQPLVAIGNFCDAALTRAKNAPNADLRLVGLLDQACEQVQRAGDIVRHLRDFVLKQHRQTVRVDLNELVVETLRFGTTMRRERGVTTQLDLANGLPSVMIDKVQVQLVLLNLERNGIEAMQDSASEQRRITLSTARSPSGVRLTIQDTGPGLDVDQVERMFDPFETSKPAGMGMGLWISRAIIQAHGGRLWCDAVQHGARFSFTLPAADADA